MNDYHEENKKVRISRSLLMTLVLGAFALGVFIGGGAIGLYTPLSSDKTEGVSGGREGEFKFIRTSLGSKSPDGSRTKRELKPFRYKVDALMADKVKRGEATSVSFYFRDLINGNRFGIGENDRFSPKSLLKVPLMIAYFKWAEINPMVLRKTLTYSAQMQQQAEEKHTKPLEVLSPGKHYTVNDLIYRMIVYDDSDAFSLLYANLPAGRLDKIFKDLNVEYDPHKDKDEDALSLAAFASFYRVLFNASYLSEEMSEKALRYLSKSSFRDGMASGIPQNIEIASKYGERTLKVVSSGEDAELFQLHEFGIIYHPGRPFLIGIMARGEDFDNLKKVIRDITSLVYEEVDQQS